MMKKRLLTVLMGTFLCAAQAFAQQKTVTGKVTSEAGVPLQGVTIIVKGTNIGTQSNGEGNYSLRATEGQVLQYRLIGSQSEERTVATATVINVQLKRLVTNLNE